MTKNHGIRLRFPVRVALLVFSLIAGLTGALAHADSAIPLATRLSYTPGGNQDPQMRLAKYQSRQNDYAASITTLRARKNDAPQATDTLSFFRQLASDSLAYGLPTRASALDLQTAATQQNANRRTAFHLRLAGQLYDRGQYKQALKWLKSAHSHLSDEQMPQWQDLTSRVYMAMGQYKAAVAVLTHPDDYGDLSHYARYNLAIALLHAGRTKDGVKSLNRVGRMSVYNRDQLALRDKANLVLGYYYLRHKQGADAALAFQRVRLNGPYSNRALLGLGWAYLTTPGHPSQSLSHQSGKVKHYPQYEDNIGALMRPGFVDTVIARSKKAKQLRHMRLLAAPTTKAMALRRALVPWAALLSRDPMDPAVQECMMALPYALNKIGAHIQAEQYYEKAVKALQQTRKRLQQATQNIRSDRMVKTIVLRSADDYSGWSWTLTDLPDAVETFYLQKIIADHLYQDALKNYRDLVQIQKRLEQDRKTLAGLRLNYVAGLYPKYPHSLYIIPAQPSHAEPGDWPSLRLSRTLESTAGAAINRAAPPSTRALGIELSVAPPPPHFNGLRDQSTHLIRAIKILQPKVDKLQQAAHQRLQDIALQALKQQDNTARKYLVQVRFALARMYDHENNVNGDSP